MDVNSQEPSRRRANGQLEAEILAALQAAGAARTPGEVVECFGGELTYSTVVTILTRLHTKQLLTRTKHGRAYNYAPVADSPGLAARRMRGVLDERPDREAVLTRFVDSLSSTDEDLLRQLLGPDPDPSR
jgi:predicted transcriptional regulator